MNIENRKRGCFYGLAVGDALGAAVEFRPPGSFAPVTCYRGFGPHHLDPGEWTDDTSMALALAHSLASGFDKHDQISRYIEWWQHGVYSVNGRCFDIGGTTVTSLRHYLETGKFKEPDDLASGNGSIMRLAPVPIAFQHLLSQDPFMLSQYGQQSSYTTHSSAKCLGSCAFMTLVLAGLMEGLPKETVLDPTWQPVADYKWHDDLKGIVNGSYKYLEPPEIVGTGFVIESLEAALWAFWKGQTFEEAVLLAVNLGQDSDTTGAVCGQFAGALWGYDGIPQSLIDGLARKDMIDLYLNPLLRQKEGT